MKNRTIMTLALGTLVGAFLVTENAEFEQAFLKGKRKMRAKMNKLNGILR